MYTHASSPHRRRRLAIATLVALTAAFLPTTAQAAPDAAAGAPTRSAGPDHQQKPRVILTTDGEIDDMDSFIRYLYYANEFDTAGIVLTSSKFHWAGDGGTVAPYRWTGTKWVNDYIDRYAKIYPNLRQHAAGYPSPARLRSLYKIGNITNVSNTAKATAGSDLIKKAILDNKPGPLYVQAWGGLNTAARALKSIEAEYKGTKRWDAVQRKINTKLVLYNILEQDATLKDYIKPNWPDVKVIDNQSQFWSFAYQWKSTVPASFQYTLRAQYMENNFLNNGHGPLLNQYRTYRDGNPTPGDDENNRWRPEASPANQNVGYDVHFISEGDSPAFLHLLDFNGLRSSTNPTYGGWGGRFAPNASGWGDTTDANPTTGNTADHSYPQTRWVEDIQNDFAARADWGRSSSYAGANHNPTAAVKPGTDITARPGAKITLRGSATDPDGDHVSYKWWQYTDADTYPGEIRLSGTDRSSASFDVPKDAAPGSTIHIILEVKDSGLPALKHYQRVVITVDKKP